MHVILESPKLQFIIAAIDSYSISEYLGVSNNDMGTFLFKVPNKCVTVA